MMLGVYKDNDGIDDDDGYDGDHGDVWVMEVMMTMILV